MTSSCPNAISSALAAASPPPPSPPSTSSPFSKQTRFSFTTRSSSHSLSSSVADARFPVSLEHRRFLFRLQQLEEVRQDALRSLPSSSSSSSSSRSRPSRRGPSSSSRANFAMATVASFLDECRGVRRVTPLSVGKLQLGCGSVSVDFLAAVASYPKPDDKIRSTSLKVQGGGNAGNALTCAARLGLNPRLISKVADDAQGKGILEELEADGVDTSFLVVSEEGNSPFTYVIVDDQTKTRTCIHTPGYPPMVPHDLSQTNLLSAIDGARIVYFDGRLYETALVVAQEVARRKIPILIDAERPREGLDDLLELADYVVCSAKFPQAWTDAPSVASALVSLMLRLPNMRFVIVTLGGEGCIMLEQSTEGNSQEEVDVDDLLEILMQRKDDVATIPTYVSSSVSQLKAEGIGFVHGRLLLGTAEKIPPQELIDTTGAGDAFIGATLYAICADMSPEKLLPFAAQVAAANCRALGARTSLPYCTDPRLAPFLS